VRNVGAEREFVLMRWGMPPPPRTGGSPVTNIRNFSSPHWRGGLKLENRCLVPFYSFAEDAPGPKSLRNAPATSEKSSRSYTSHSIEQKGPSGTAEALPRLRSRTLGGRGATLLQPTSHSLQRTTLSSRS
jgi:hypothetical protein